MDIQFHQMLYANHQRLPSTSEFAMSAVKSQLEIFFDHFKGLAFYSIRQILILHSLWLET